MRATVGFDCLPFSRIAIIMTARAALLLTILVAVALPQFASGASRPNIVLMVADDQRPDTIAALGNSIIRTPALDRLVREGTSFMRAVCAYPICVASRAEILTGCTAFRALQPYPDGKLNDSLPLLPRTLQAAGYRTCYVGKWHTTGRPTVRGYDLSHGLFAAGGANLALTVPTDRFGKAHTGYRGWIFQDDAGHKFPERGVGLTPNISQRFADAAIEFIQSPDIAPAQRQPFFLHVNFTAPHDPRLTPKGYEAAYDPTRIALPKNFAPDHPFDHGNQGGRDEVLLPRPLDEAIVREELATYYALIEHLDAQVGRIVDALANRGELQNTVIIYTSDHGLALGSHGLTGKQNMYEHTIGVPLVMAGPGVPRGSRLGAQCYLRDLYPTICQWCDVPVPAKLDGRELQPLLDGSSQEIYPFVVGYFTDTQRMIRDSRWKLIRYPQARRVQLFDVAADPDELHDLSTDAEQATTAAQLQRQLDDWLAVHGDPLASQPPGK